MATPVESNSGNMALVPQRAQRFLDTFLQEFPAPLDPDASLPAKPQSSILSPDEVEGEMIEFGLRLLHDRNAPPLLAAAVVHAAVGEMLQADLTVFEKKLDSSQDDVDNTLLEAQPLQHSFFNKLWEVCASWHKKMPALQHQKRYLQISCHAIRNTRRKMEDKHVSLQEFNQLFGLKDDVDRSYFAIFDGHGGVDAAIYAATHLHVNVKRRNEITQNPIDALKESFEQTDTMFLQKAKREKLRSGTTGVTALISGNTLHVAWLGDSQVMMVRHGKDVTLMEAHRPEREDEKLRIEALGGCVSYMGCWRVNGTLGVSRAIGDVDQKPYISGKADGASFELTGAEDYILLACDGFFDAIKQYEVADIVLDHLRKHNGDGSQTAESLVAAAKWGGSSDNITVLVVFLRDPQAILMEQNSFTFDNLGLNKASEASDGPFSFFNFSDVKSAEQTE
ncbi:protein phosphatase 1F isoform X2 [Protopterus annectens]|uniref:protein phosphatase 1F isoform X2 n=1 Tax=Protopterus annectens TaxID=7888 RepID=UPI001CFA6B6A|nr:protein phosphatase 1F isoform X2 [Protopterus annectens]